MRGAWRLVRALAHALAGWYTIRFEFPRLAHSEKEQRVQAWAQGMLRILGVGLRVTGQPPGAGPVLLVANHMSWLDIVVLHAARHCHFVSKSDVRHWPLLGALATGAGTLYIERESRRDAMRVVHHMAERLREGEVLAVFPEGTTSHGHGLLPFHGNLIQAAISTDAPVQPVALSFMDEASGQATVRPCFVGDDTMIESVWRTVSGPPVTAVVAFGAPELAAGRTRREWAAQLRSEVEKLRLHA